MNSNEREFSSKALEDFDLIDRAVQGKDQSAYATLMKRYKKAVYFMILKMIRDADDADDLTMEAFAKAFRNLERFKKEYTFYLAFSHRDQQYHRLYSEEKAQNHELKQFFFG